MHGDVDWRANLLGLAAGLTALGVLYAVVGVGDVTGVLSRADPTLVAAAVVASLLWLLCWGLALRQILVAAGVTPTATRSVLLMTVSVCLNNVTPSGEPFTAAVIARSTEARYETGLATVATLRVVNLVPTTVMAAVGVGYFATTLSGRATRTLFLSIGALFALFALVLGVVLLFRDRVRTTLVRVVPAAVVRVGRRLPGVTPTRDGVAARVEGFFDDVGRIATDRVALTTSVLLSGAGWFFIAVVLWLSLLSVGYSVALAAPVIAVPVGTVASSTPLPGGLGGTELLLSGVLTQVTPLTTSAVAAGVLIHRGATYWLPVVLGAIVLVTTVARRE